MVYNAAPPSRLLTPPREDEEVYPYRHVWRSIIAQCVGVGVAAIGLYVLSAFLGLGVPSELSRYINIALALWPAFLWGLFAWLPERRAIQPRHALVGVFVVSALAALAVGSHVAEDIFLDNRWLSLSSALERIIGYTFTLGALHEGIKYLVIRWLVWPDHLRIRLDAIAYADAAAVGYATIAALQFIAAGNPDPAVVAARVFSLYVLHLTTSCVVSYGLAESRFANAQFLLLPLTFMMSMTLTGLAIPLRAGFVNADIAVAALIVPRQLFGLGFTTGLLVGVMAVVAFLYQNAERQEEEKRIGGSRVA
jgi:RsiW-degrading membrane proteinase PrsW (M82 family)